MFERAIWDKLPECIFENFEIARVKRGQFQNFHKSASRQLQNSGQLQNTPANGTMSITISHVISTIMPQKR